MPNPQPNLTEEVTNLKRRVAALEAMIQSIADAYVNITNSHRSKS